MDPRHVSGGARERRRLVLFSREGAGWHGCRLLLVLARARRTAYQQPRRPAGIPPAGRRNDAAHVRAEAGAGARRPPRDARSAPVKRPSSIALRAFWVL